MKPAPSLFVVMMDHPIDQTHCDEFWPQAFPEPGDAWTASECGRVVVKATGLTRATRDIWQFDWGDLCGRFDQATGEVRIERSHPGRQDLFYFDGSGILLIATHSESIMRSVECSQDLGSMVHYLAYGLPVPGRTLAEGVHCLPVATELTCRSESSPRLQPKGALWGDRFPRDPGMLPDIATAVDRAVQTALAEPIDSILLSSGLDSSFLALAAEGRDLAAFTVRYPGLEFPDEVEHAREIAALAGHRHQTVDVSLSDAAVSMEGILASPQPCSAWSTISHELVMSTISHNGNSTILSGLGADEFLGGYGPFLRGYQAMAKTAIELDPQGLQSPLRTVTGSIELGRRGLYTGVPKFLSPHRLQQALEPLPASIDPLVPSFEFYRRVLQVRPDIRLCEAMTAHEAAHRIPDLLFRGFEPIARSHGLTTVYPLLDPLIYQASSQLEIKDFFRPKEKGTSNKHAWRTFLADKLPRAILERDPSTYDAPFGQWMRDPVFSASVLDRISGSRILQTGLLDKSWVSNLVDTAAKLRDPAFKPENKRLREELWIVLTLTAWHDEWIG